MRRLLNLAAAIASLIAAASSCCGSKVDVIQLVVWESFPLSEGSEHALDMKISMDLPATGMSQAAKENLSGRLVELIFGEDYAGLDPGSAASAYMDVCADEYRAEAQELEGLTASLSYENDIEASVYTSGKRAVSYVVTQFTYSGGAHGMTMELAYNFDRESGDLLFEEDIFKSGYEAELAHALQAHLPESLPDGEDMEALFVTEIQPNGNFILTDDEITYIYNRYDIAPYALGSIWVTVPLDELGEILQ